MTSAGILRQNKMSLKIWKRMTSAGILHQNKMSFKIWKRMTSAGIFRRNTPQVICWIQSQRCCWADGSIIFLEETLCQGYYLAGDSGRRRCREGWRATRNPSRHCQRKQIIRRQLKATVTRWTSTQASSTEINYLLRPPKSRNDEFCFRREIDRLAGRVRVPRMGKCGEEASGPFDISLKGKKRFLSLWGPVSFEFRYWSVAGRGGLGQDADKGRRLF